MAEPSSIKPTPWLWRYVPSAAGLLCYLLFIWLRLEAPQVYDAILRTTDLSPNDLPFDDLTSILRAGVCWREGVNVYAPSHCMLGGVFNYSPFMLWGAYLNIGPQASDPAGLALGMLWLASLALLPPPAGNGELWLRVLAVCSETTLRALAVANFDIVIFMLMLLGLVLVLAGRKIAAFGYALFAFLAACKFYPAVLLSTLIRERRETALTGTVLCLAAGLLYLLCFGRGTAQAIAILPFGSPFFGTFGVRNIPFGLTLLWYLPEFTLLPDYAQFRHAITQPHAAQFVILASHLLGLAVLLAALMMAPRYATAWGRLDARRQLFFAAGALIILGSYLTVQNIYYRAIFLLPVLPALYAMAALSDASGRRRLCALQLGVLILFCEASLRFFVACLSAGSVHAEAAFWLFRELLWLWVAVQLGAILVCFFRYSLSRLAVREAHG